MREQLLPSEDSNSTYNKQYGNKCYLLKIALPHQQTICEQMLSTEDSAATCNKKNCAQMLSTEDSSTKTEMKILPFHNLTLLEIIWTDCPVPASTPSLIADLIAFQVVQLGYHISEPSAQCSDVIAMAGHLLTQSLQYK